MKKRILASFVSLCLIVGLLPTAVLAVEEPGNNLPQVCTCEARCTVDTVDENCPVCAVNYTACTYEAPTEPTEPPAEEKVCGNFSGCEGEAHDPQCPLYVAPAEPPAPAPEVISPEIPVEIQAFLDAAESLDPEQPDTIEAAWAAYKALSGEQQAREDVAKGFEALLDAERQNAVIFAPVAENAVYVSETGNDSNDGSQANPYATLANAVEMAEDGATIYLLSDLEITKNARITDKHLTFTSAEGKTYTLTRGADFESTSDNHQSYYNPGFIEVTTNGSEASENASSVTLTNIILDDEGIHEGTYFAQTNVNVTGETNGNLDHVQDSIITAHGLENRAVHIILGNGAVLKDFGGMSAVYGTTNAHITMQAGSEIYDKTVTDRKASADQKVKGETGPAGAVWLQGAEFVMEDGAEIHDVVGRAVYADGGKASIGGTISGITGDKDMWQGWSGAAVHIRGKGYAVLESTGRIDTITGEHDGYRGAIVTNGSRGNGLYDFEMKAGSIISNVTGFPVLFSNYGTELLNGTIENCSNDYIIGGFAQNTTIGNTALIHKNITTQGAAKSIIYTSNASKVYMNGTLKDNDVGTAAFYIINQSGGGAYLEISNGAVIQGKDNNHGVYINASGSKCVMNGGTISHFGRGVYCRGKANNKSATFIMNGGTITENAYGVYFDGNSSASNSIVNLIGGNITKNKQGYQIYANYIYNSNETNERLFINSGVLNDDTIVNLAFGKVTLDKDYANISLGRASDAAKGEIQNKVTQNEGNDWSTLKETLWFKPTTESFHFTMPRPTELNSSWESVPVNNILYAGYIPLNVDGTPAEEAVLNLIQLDGAGGSVMMSNTLDVTLTGLEPNQPYALMLVKSPTVVVSPMELAKYVTDGTDNDFPKPRYTGISKNATFRVNGQEWTNGYPFTIKYYQQDGITPLTDDSKPGTYVAKVEPVDGVQADNIQIDGKKVVLGASTLSIRDVTDVSKMTDTGLLTPVITAEPTARVTRATMFQTSSTYKVNGQSGQKPSEGAEIRLLEDKLLPGAETILREKLNQKLGASAGEKLRRYTMTYLDLVDANDSNVFLTAASTGKVYMPYPDGTDMNSGVEVYTFDLDRSYTADGTGVDKAAQSSAPQKLNAKDGYIANIEYTQNGIKIKAKEVLGKVLVLTWTSEPVNYTVTFDSAGGSAVESQTVTEGKTVAKPNDPIRDGYDFDGWYLGNDVYDFTSLVTGDITLTARWSRHSGGGGSSTRYIIEADAGRGGSISPSGKVRVDRNDDQTFRITADQGYVISDVLVDGKSVGAVSRYTFENVRKDHTIEAVFAVAEKIPGVADPDDTGVSRWLNTHDHMAFLSGYTNGNFGPDDNMTRAQAAQMFYRLLLKKDVPITVQFSDVPADAWYATAVNTLASLGIVNGIGNNQFAPERQITRAEFTVIAMRFGKLDTSGSNIFTDVNADDWFYDQVVGAIKYGWIGGYADGTFRPNNTITRAEVTVIVNRMLGRAADPDFVAAHADELRKFDDVPASYWAYEQIMEATNAHEYRSSSNGEKWTGLVD